MRRFPVGTSLGCVLLTMLSLTSTTKAASGPVLKLVVSNETTPPGGVVQFKISLAAPANIASGKIIMDLDPGIFGDIVSAAVFSAGGDAYGLVMITNGHHLVATFTSPSASVGQLPDLPVMAVTAPVL